MIYMYTMIGLEIHRQQHSYVQALKDLSSINTMRSHQNERHLETVCVLCTGLV